MMPERGPEGSSPPATPDQPGREAEPDAEVPPAKDEPDPADADVIRSQDQFLEALRRPDAEGGSLRLAADADLELPTVVIRDGGRWIIQAAAGDAGSGDEVSKTPPIDAAAVTTPARTRDDVPRIPRTRTLQTPPCGKPASTRVARPSVAVRYISIDVTHVTYW